MKEVIKGAVFSLFRYQGLKIPDNTVFDLSLIQRGLVCQRFRQTTLVSQFLQAQIGKIGKGAPDSNKLLQGQSCRHLN